MYLIYIHCLKLMDLASQVENLVEVKIVHQEVREN
jgi:hypothetical protein